MNACAEEPAKGSARRGRSGRKGPASAYRERMTPEASPADERRPRLLLQLRALRPSLSPAEDRVAERVLVDVRAAAALTISELAAAAETSETTVLRFCRRLGLPGYPQLRLALAEEGASPRLLQAPAGDISPDDTVDDVIQKVAFAESSAIEDTAEQLDRDVLDAVARLVASAGRVDIYGHGASALVAEDLQQKLLRIGRVAFAAPDPHVALVGAALLSTDDVAIAVSHSGTTREVIEAVEQAKRSGATTVAITNFPVSAMAKTVDHVLLTSARESAVRAGATASRVAALMVVDCLYLTVANRDIATAQAAVSSTRQAVAGHRIHTDDTA